MSYNDNRRNIEPGTVTDLNRSMAPPRPKRRAQNWRQIEELEQQRDAMNRAWSQAESELTTLRGRWLWSHCLAAAAGATTVMATIWYAGL